jgi:muconate cycloisomerase
MRIENAALHFLEIPFKLSVSHGARAGRTLSDSLILCLAGTGKAGYGEAVVRDYVSGSLGTGVEFHDEAARIATELLAPLRERDISWNECAAHFSGVRCETRALPLLCAAEAACLALAAEEAEADPYTILGRPPARGVVFYGGVLPIFPLAVAGTFIDMCARMRLPDLKVKLGPDQEYNKAILSLCRGRLGPEWDIRVDANGAWTVHDAEAQAVICERFGVRLVEQPFPVALPVIETGLEILDRHGCLAMADEGVLTAEDVRRIAAAPHRQMLNLRLSKNGGISRVLALAAQADEAGLAYQLGCMVGETGVLSCLGRLAASLLPHPTYVEGGYEEILLESNITVPGFPFGAEGKGLITRGKGMGYRVDESALAKLSRSRVAL